MADPLVLAGGPCSANPEPMARFIDAFVLGDGEEALPAVCDLWLELRQAGLDRTDALARLAATLPYLYVPRFYEPQFDAQGRPAGVRPTRDDVPARIEPAVVQRPRRRAGARGPHRAVHRVRSRTDRHRDHARLSVALPLLPEPGLEASGPLPPRGDDRRRGPASLSGDGARRSRAAGTLVERLSRRSKNCLRNCMPSSGRWA